MRDKIELLSIDLIDRHRELVELIYALGSKLKINIGWHYILDLAWIVMNMKDLPKGSIVLDAGAGNGLLQFVLASLGYKVISVDFSPRIPPQICKNNWDIIEIDSGTDHDNEYIRHLKATYSGAYRQDSSVSTVINADEVRNIFKSKPRVIIYYRADITEMKFIQDDSVDCVVSVSALEHNSHIIIKNAVRELERVLKKDHRMLLTVSATDQEDWFHEQSKGWCFTERSIVELFDLKEHESNCHSYAELFEKLKTGRGLRDNLAAFYYNSGNNGMPWGIWDPKYQPVGIRKIKHVNTCCRPVHACKEGAL